VIYPSRGSMLLPLQSVKHSNSIKRRQFIKTSALAASSLAISHVSKAKSANALLSGIQISPPNLLDEGIERCLDFIQEHAAIDSIFCYSQTYHMGARPVNVLATDHPAPPIKEENRSLPYLWMKLPKAPFKRLSVQHEASDSSLVYANRDLFQELVKPCRERGIKIYARILEAGMRRAARIPGYTSVAAIDIDGDPSHGPCWNHPDYREWVKISIEQMMICYPLDGLQYGAERVGTMSEVLFRGIKPACFCQHCQKRNAAQGISTERAKEGYRKLYQLVQQLESGKNKPTDGVFASILRIIMRYPETLAWYNEWLKADEEIQTMVYQTAKAKRPDADVGQHIDHQRSSWDIFYRAAVSYEDMAKHNDFVKPILYHDILGPRLQQWVIDEMQQRILGDLSKDLALELFYALFGHQNNNQPSYQQLAKEGLSPEYVYQETKRCVKGVKGQAKVYAGIGFDVPTYVPDGMEPFPSTPETTYRATRRAIEAGAHGVVASREYDEMTLPNLKAFGRAVRDT
jgi:hypothetical protein